MSNQKKVIAISRDFNGEREILTTQFPFGGTTYKSCTGGELNMLAAFARFNDGQAIYANGVRFNRVQA